MIDPSQFNLTTDLDTIINDSYQTASVVIPGSIVLAAGGRAIYTSDVTISNSAVADIRYQTSRDTTRDYLASIQMSFTRTGSLGGYSLFIDGYHTSPTNLRLQAFITNPYGSTMTAQAGDETISFKIRTYKDPFA